MHDHIKFGQPIPTSLLLAYLKHEYGSTPQFPKHGALVQILKSKLDGLAIQVHTKCVYGRNGSRERCFIFGRPVDVSKPNPLVQADESLESAKQWWNDTVKRPVFTTTGKTLAETVNDYCDAQSLHLTVQKLQDELGTALADKNTLETEIQHARASRDQSEAKVRRMDTFQTEALCKKDKELTRLRADLDRMKERLSAIDQQALRATPMQCAVCRPIRGPS